MEKVAQLELFGENRFKDERIDKQITNVNYVRNAYIELLPNYILNKNNSKIIDTPTIYEQIQTQEDIDLVGQDLALLKYGSTNCYLHDLGCGVLTALTNTNNIFTNFELTKSAIILDLSIENVKKLMFGHIVKDNGNAINHAGDIVRQNWHDFKQYFTNQKPFPQADVSIKKAGLEFIARGYPIRVNRVYLKNQEPIGFQLQLDRMFYPIKENEKSGFKTNDLFLHQISGLTAFLQFSKQITDLSKVKNPPDAKTARRLILTYQSAYKVNQFPFVSHKIIRKQNTNSDRVEILLSENAIREIYPRAIKSKYIRYKDFINFCNTVGLYYQNGIQYFNLKLNDNILIPTKERAARFSGKRIIIVCEKGNVDFLGSK